jgi:hypothetical protein
MKSKPKPFSLEDKAQGALDVRLHNSGQSSPAFRDVILTAGGKEIIRQRAGQSSPAFRRWMEEQGTAFLESRKATVQAGGDGSGWAILECLDAAMGYGLPIPEWLSTAYQERFLSVKMGSLRHLEDGQEWGRGAFGKVPSIEEYNPGRRAADGRLLLFLLPLPGR